MESLFVTDRKRRVVAIGEVTFGTGSVPIIAGPCSVEPEYVSQAQEVAQAGAAILRGCIFKPRTRPSSFQGLGEEGIESLALARRRTGLPAIAEPLSPVHIDLLHPHVDGFLIGSRSMHNTPLLRAAGGSGLPIILKRGLAATYEEWLGAAEYVTDAGGNDLILCERGIRTFETTTRNTLDISAVPILHELTDFPVIIDPSHAAGEARWVPALALAAVAAGADGLLIECHPSPQKAWSDAAQTVTPATLRAIHEKVGSFHGFEQESGAHA